MKTLKPLIVYRFVNSQITERNVAFFLDINLKFQSRSTPFLNFDFIFLCSKHKAKQIELKFVHLKSVVEAPSK
jgi:hypothetical protein